MASTSSEPTSSESDQTAFTVIAGDCRVEVDIEDRQIYRGQVLVIVKPDDTVLVHDIDGYQPVAWMTRAERVVTDGDAGTVTAVDGNRWLRVQVISSLVDRRVPGTVAGSPIGSCPDCGGRLIHGHSEVHCVSCRNRYGLPKDATLGDTRCDCGLPHMRIERGEVFDLCIDRHCDPMEQAIAERFDGTWSCPSQDCSGVLRVVRRRHLLLACDAYPDCETAFRFPTGVVDAHCGCGLPRFTTADGSRCLDRGCSPTA